MNKFYNLTVIFVFLSTFSLYSQTENVGIGTSTPDNSATLHVQYVSTPKGILIPRMSTIDRNNISSPANGLLIFNDSTDQFEYYNLAETKWIPLISNSTGWSLSGNSGTTPGTDFIGTTDSVGFAIFTNDTERIRVDANGNIGIGTTTPTAKLDISGDFKLGTNSSVLSEIIRDTVTIDLPSISPSTSYVATVSISNAALGSSVVVSPSASLGDNTVIATARVASAGSVDIRFVNVRSQPTINFNPMDFYITVIR